jgi:hypothetical protein
MENTPSAPKPVSLAELEEITCSFSEHRKLGGGAYGIVYLVRFNTIFMLSYIDQQFVWSDMALLHICELTDTSYINFRVNTLLFTPLFHFTTILCFI